MAVSAEAATTTAEAVAAAASAAGSDQSQSLPTTCTSTAPQNMLNSAACQGPGILTNAHVVTDGSAMVSVVNSGPAHPLQGVVEATIQNQVPKATVPFANPGRPKVATNLAGTRLQQPSAGRDSSRTRVRSRSGGSETDGMILGYKAVAPQAAVTDGYSTQAP